MLRWSFLRTCPPGAWLLLAPLLLVPACKGGSGSSSSSATAPAPSVTSISPASGPPGTQVTLTGRNLADATCVAFQDGVAAPFTADSATQVTAFVPAGATTGPVSILCASGSAVSGTFTVTAPPVAAPFVDVFWPLQGSAYTRVYFGGRGFTGLTGLAFGGVPAAFVLVLDDRTLEAVVPSGAVSGPITLLHPAGDVATSTPFTVDPALPRPMGITRAVPDAGPPGTDVRLIGFGLDGVQTAAFGAIAVPFRPQPDGRTLLVTVPEGAVTGPILLTGPQGGTARWPLFTVTAPPAATPSITSIRPGSGFPGTPITVSGQHLAGVRSAGVGGREARFSVVDDGEVEVFVPEQDPASGTVVLTFDTGPVSSLTPFTVTFPAPGITGFFPVSGPPGTRITLQGTHLDSPFAVRVGGVPVTSPVESSPGEIRLLVPAGAATGPITVRTAGGEVQTPQAFQVTDLHGSLNLAIAGLYVTQATQRLDRSVPLVAGRPGKLRVFLQADVPNTLHPTVQVTLLDAGGATLLTREIPAPGDGIPTAVDEFAPSASWDLDLAGELIQPGLRVLARILPLAAPGWDLNLADDVYPAEGQPLALNVRAVPPIGITLVPVAQAGTVGVVSTPDRPVSRWLEKLREIYPLQDIDLQVAPVFNYGGVITDGESYTQLLEDLETARVAADPQNRRYHYGVVTLPPDSEDLGAAIRNDVPGDPETRVAAGFDGTLADSPYSFSDAIAHELGHNLGRQHAPCGDPGNPDPNYPYPNAHLGAAGLQVGTGERFLGHAVDKDIMSYCPPFWVSDYTYRSVLEARAGEPMVLPAVPAATQPGLLVSGRVVDGAVTLEPTLEVAGASAFPRTGPYTLVIRDAGGTILQTQSFGVQLLEDVPDHLAGIFVFALPLTAEAAASMASVEVQGAGGAGTLARSGLTALGARLPRDPVATAWRPGVVHLSWDASAHPRVLVKDAATGAVIGIARGGSADLVTNARDLDLSLSAGARSVNIRAAVGP